MNHPSELTRVAALLADPPKERFLVVGYDVDGKTLQQTEIIEAPSAEAALELGRLIAERHATVVVMRQTEDWLGVVRSAVLKWFDSA